WKPFVLAFFAFVVYWMSLDPLRLEYTILLVPTLWYPLYVSRSIRVVPEPAETKKRNIVWRSLRNIAAFPSSFYGQLWLASILFWSVVAFWLTCPHPATILGWIAVAVYVGIYFPIFIALTRLLLKYVPYSVAVAPAFAWLITEWFRKHLMGGFSFASLEHAFYRHPILIQTADLYGEYTVGTLIVLLGTGLALMVHLTRRSRYGKACLTFAYLTILATAAMVYGVNRYDHFVQVEQTAREIGKKVRVVLLQEPTTFRFPVPEDTNQRIHQDYLDLATHAARPKEPCDLIVWPESSFMFPWVEIPPEGVPHEWSQLTFPQRMEQIAKVTAERDKKFQYVSQSLDSAVLLGSTTIEYGPAGHMDFYNSAIFIPRSGASARYDKMQLVIFGEYLPFANYLPDWFPLKTLCNSVTPGKKAIAFSLNARNRTVVVVPNICFESSIPHLIWGQVQQLRAQGQEPDLLINMSNDGWFQYMPQIDYHLAAHVFRAVENRKHFLSATHAGFASWVDPSGRIRACGDRKKAQAVIADIYYGP
ncbi:MAG: apolipoprotein N-acyltransferase, partial [Planctomycetia bacterium]|nr:apolipoprotein N-acyltransferase [Planctomycetia bacterium]